jgi:DNA replication licensing factor MCM7
VECPPLSNLYFRPPRNQAVLAVRAVRGAHLGKLITVRGIVTRVSEVKPLLLVNAYTCDMCGNEIFQEIAQKSFTPLTKCPSATCQRNGAQGNLHMQTRASRFRPFQEVKIQEMVSARFGTGQGVIRQSYLCRGFHARRIKYRSDIFLDR